jgi:sugar lactone lactonase YvrE
MHFTFSMNDLVAVDKDKFYITKFYGSARDGEKQKIEISDKQRLGQILFYDGAKAKVVSPEYFLQPNGINASPDKR